MNDETENTPKEKNRSRIPTYSELKFESLQVFELTEKLKEEGVGEVPLYIDLSALGPEQTQEALKNLAQSLILLNLHPYFPYPLYVITNKVGHHDVLPIIPSVSDLPEHFNNKIKRLKQKEQLLLNKVKLKSNRLANVALYDKIAEIKKQFKSQKRILRACQENEFYEYIREKLNIHKL